MMREMKIFAVVVFFTLLVYWGVEPYAHGVMHKHVDSKNFAYSDLADVTKTGDAQAGAEKIHTSGCTGCHGIESQGMSSPMDPVMSANAYGVVPPDLSTAGLIYDEKFLAAVIKDPATAMKVNHKFDGVSAFHPMPSLSYSASGDLDQDIADIVAYLKSIAPASISDEQAYYDACGRCHDMRYTEMTVFGKQPDFANKQEEYKFKMEVAEYKDKLRNYMGKTPPDLSMMFGSRRGEGYIGTFIEDPQVWLEGTSMPRVGVNKETADQIMAYMESSSDPAKEQRNALGPWVIGFTILFTIVAFFWKKSMWRDLH
jgi:ubiquinol-cytochrome c reductase cytochrome c1 subunit